MRSRSPRQSRPALALAAALVAPALLLSACGSNDSGKDASSSASSSSAGGSAGDSASASAPASTAALPNLTPAVKGDLAGVTVAGTKDAPKIKIDKPPFSVKETTVKVLTPGSGETVTKDDTIIVNVAIAGGKSGKTLDDTYARKATDTWQLTKVLPGLARAVIDQKIGSRVVAGLAPADAGALVAQNNPQAGVAADETIVAVIDIIKMAPKPLKEATGAAVAPKAGFPTAKFEYGKPATITIPKTPAPTKLESQVLVQGTGDVVKAGQSVQVHYTGVTWSTGKVFDSNFKRGTEPFTTKIGVGQVIPAWDKSVVGQKVGSRILIVAPPNEAYGAQAQGDIPANSTLVFLVDILAAA